MKVISSYVHSIINGLLLIKKSQEYNELQSECKEILVQFTKEFSENRSWK